ncbi:MAG TPA: LptE family protein [Pseudobdellovibrionaceae bacterium]|nr:LptE family protein [Pseudobdellovibrionaceae bacterium]
MKRTFFIIFGLSLFISSCVHYQLGTGRRSLTGGYQQVALPLFKNKSMEPGIEVEFTNALMQEFQRSKAVKVVDKNLSEVELRGTIESVSYVPGGLKTAEPSSVMPSGSVIATAYTIQVRLRIELIKKHDQSVVWSGSFSGERGYSAPQVTIPGINSVNPNYNLSARRLQMGLIANDMMIEVHDRMTETF